MTKAYIEITLNLNSNLYIWALCKLILQPKALFDSIFKVITLLYGKLEIDNHRFIIYYIYYKKKPKITESTNNSFILSLI